jgi:DnaJ-class molecular chaperone
MPSTTAFVDYYAFLGMPSTTSIEEIRTAIREKRDFLLDSTTEDSVVFEQCILLRKIEEILCDEARKSEYDAEYQTNMSS